jgi:hypothetical protein
MKGCALSITVGVRVGMRVGLRARVAVVLFYFQKYDIAVSPTAIQNLHFLLFRISGNTTVLLEKRRRQRGRNVGGRNGGRGWTALHSTTALHCAVAYNCQLVEGPCASTVRDVVVWYRLVGIVCRSLCVVIEYQH